MFLLELPNELLIEISKCVLPDDIENFPMTCSRIRILSEPMLREHKKLTVKYTHLQVFKETVPSTLTEFCTGHYRLAEYPILVDIMPWDPYSPFNRIETDTAMRVSAMAKRTGLFPSDRAHHWWSRIDSCDVAITYFLLPCLPNLEGLRFVGRKRNELLCVQELVTAVVESQRRSENPQALSKLTDLTLTPSRDLKTSKFKFFIPFMQLHSMRRVSASFVDCRGLEQVPFPPCSSLVEYLRLSRCTVPAESWWTLLSGFKELKVLVHSPLLRRNFHPQNMRDALFVHQRHTLERLDVLSRQPADDFMGSLREFTALKVVKLNPALLLNDNCMSRLVRIFPPSVESIELDGNIEGEAEVRFFDNFILLREAVPNLKHVYAHDYFNQWPYGFAEPEGDFEFIYRNISHKLPPGRPFGLARRMMSWYGLDKRGQWTKFGDGLNVDLFKEVDLFEAWLLGSRRRSKEI